MARDLGEIIASKRKAEEEIKIARAELKATKGKFLVDHFSELFEKYPEVKGLRWHQYTPYFNDGDACHFSSNHDGADILVMEDGELMSLDDSESTEYKRLLAIKKEFWKHFPQLTDDDMESIFGDHVEVTVYPDLVDVVEYDHN